MNKELKAGTEVDSRTTAQVTTSSQPCTKPTVSGSLLMRSLSLLEEMIDNHQADAVQMSDQHYEEVKVLVKEIRKSKRM